MSPLSDAEIAAFERDGVLVLPSALSAAQLSALKRDLDGWIEESRRHEGPYGETLDGRPRFDVEPGHDSETPKLRRVASPAEISPAYEAVMRDNRALDAVAQLFSPNIAFHHDKLNAKLPGGAAEVKWHQDFAFDPHSNDDVMTVLFFLDEVTEENGPLEVAPGSHRGPLHSHWRGEVFTGAAADPVAAEARAAARRCLGPAGAACLMKSRVLHASAANRSAGPRTLYIVTYAAEDARPLAPNHLPSRHEGAVVRGSPTGRARTIPFEMRLPERPREASFFAQQAKQA